MNFLNASSTFGLGVLLAFGAVLAVLRFGRGRRERLIQRLVGPTLAARLSAGVDYGKRRLRSGLFLGGLACLAVAGSRPWWGQRLVHSPRRTRDLLLCIDCSRSMLARDIAPSRLLHAKWWVRQLVSDCPGDRFGLIAFAGDAFLECPLTQDRNTLFQFLDDLDTNTIAVGGTNLARAMQTALEAFKAAEGGHRAVILLSDGEELQGDSKAEVADLHQARVPLFVVGVGDPRQGTPIQVEDNSFLRDKDGKIVSTRVNEAALKELSEQTGGIYVRTTAVTPNVEPVLRRVKELVPEEREVSATLRPIERYQVPLFLAVACFLLRLLLGERRTRPGAAIVSAMLACCTLANAGNGAETKADRPPPAGGDGGGLGLPMILGPDRGPSGAKPSAGAGHPGDAAGPASGAPEAGPAKAEDVQAAAEREWARQQQERKVKLEADLAATRKELETADPEQAPRLHYNAGYLYQRLGNLDQALQEYEAAVSGSRSQPVVRAAAFGNLGVVLHSQAREKLSSDPDACLDLLKRAEDCYREAMLLTPGGKDAARNQEILLRERQLATEIQSLAQKLRDLQKRACEETGKALADQRAANAANEPAQKATQTTQAAEQAQAAESSTQQLEQAARDLQQEKAAEYVQGAREEIQKGREAQARSQQVPRTEESKKESEELAAEHLRNAFRMLGGQEQPPQSQPQSGEKSDKQEQDQQAQQDQTAEQRQEQPGGQQPPQSEPGKDVVQQAKDEAADPSQEAAASDEEKGLKLDPDQAQSILVQMQQQEKDLRQALKLQRLQKQRLPEVEKNW
jgi:Ca-activated chloride channel family protein